MLTGILKIDGPNVNKQRHIFKSILIVVMNFIQFDYLWEKLFSPEDELIRVQYRLGLRVGILISRIGQAVV
jgi:hypothetical protein